MTTIAYRDGVIAADSSIMCGSTIQYGVKKIVKVDGILAGVCGDANWGFKFLDWMSEGMKGQYPKAKNGTAVVIIKKQIFVYDPDPWVMDVPYYATGNGRDQALGAMFVGANAIQAVEAAAAHDIYTNGKVQWEQI